jgi:hypothetical protein
VLMPVVARDNRPSRPHSLAINALLAHCNKITLLCSGITECMHGSDETFLCISSAMDTAAMFCGCCESCEYPFFVQV